MPIINGIYVNPNRIQHKPLSEGRNPPPHNAGSLLEECQKGNSETVMKLLAFSTAEVNKSDELGETPLMAATKSGSFGIVHALLTNGAAPKMQDSQGETALHHAVQLRGEDVVSIVRALIEAAPELLTTVDKSGHLPLHHYCDSLELDVGLLKYLVPDDADISIQNKDGFTPADLLAGHMHWYILAQLIPFVNPDREENLMQVLVEMANEQPAQAFLFLSYAACFDLSLEGLELDRVDVDFEVKVDNLRAMPPSTSLDQLEFAMKMRAFLYIKRYLKAKGYPKDFKDIKDDSFLHMICKYGDYGCLRKAILHGGRCDLNHANTNGERPLDILDRESHEGKMMYNYLMVSGAGDHIPNAETDRLDPDCYLILD